MKILLFPRFAALISKSIVLVGISIPAMGQVIDLGDAQGFNATIFGNLVVAGGDTEGRLAVGGDATFTQGGYTVGGAYIGTQNPSSATRDDLVIGGHAIVQTGYIGVEYGNVKVGGTISGSGSFGVTLGSIEPNVPSFPSTVFNFAETEALIRSYSTAWSQLSSNGVVEEFGTAILLRGTSPSQNVFHVSASQWSGTSKVIEILVPTGSTTIINVSGTVITATNGGMHFLEEWFGPGSAPVPREFGPNTYNRLDQFSSESIAFRQGSVINLYEATTISSTSTAWEGMFIAPDAFFTGSAGWINGQAFIGSVDNSNGFEFHNFYTNVPPMIIPEPGTLVMVGVLLSTFVSSQMLRKRSQR